MSRPPEQRDPWEAQRLRLRAASELRRENLAKTRAALRDGSRETRDWGMMRKVISRQVFPRIQGWIREIKAVIDPAQVRQLHRARRRLEKLTGITWWHPRGMVWRARVAFYGTSILILSLLFVAVVFGGLVLMAFAVYRILGWLQDFFAF
ncbi:hypothetical protein SCOR_24590 [Sulfidibacter corallicola]|uniref:Uncharacterized protein n=1 Tax=Sulfidibacter corallicola TaxID=2818388 RepID=A0A8A4TTD2_SULCO|nr:hypothetical protein [Sulfidibacter corallicola]QTD52414.1 hypothetical protein J3U87_08065 [Sulfidibacter corallicola]